MFHTCDLRLELYRPCASSSTLDVALQISLAQSACGGKHFAACKVHDLRYAAELLVSTFFKASQKVSLTAERVNKPQQLPLPAALQHSVMIIALLCGDAFWHAVVFIPT